MILDRRPHQPPQVEPFLVETDLAPQQSGDFEEALHEVGEVLRCSVRAARAMVARGLAMLEPKLEDGETR